MMMMMIALNSQRKNYKNLYPIMENTLILCLKKFKVDADILAMMKATVEANIRVANTKRRSDSCMLSRV